MSWLYLPGMAGFPLPSGECGGIEPFVTLSGMPTQRPLSWPGWKRRDWIKRLCGLTSPPSTVARGVAAWISSLPDFPASRSPRQASSWELMTTVGSGHPSPGYSLRWNPDTCSWRTCHSLFDMDYPKSSLTLPASGSMRSGVCSARPPLAPPTAANGSGSWATQRSSDDQGSGMRGGARGSEPMLRGQVKQWPTPAAHNAKGAGDSQLDRNTPGLPILARQWPTPNASRVANRTDVNLSGDGRDTPNKLGWAVKQWPTPRASDGTRGTDPPHGQGGDSLKTTVTHHPQATTPDGPTGSPKVDLNPEFVAALMGLPPGWLTIPPCEVCS